MTRRLAPALVLACTALVLAGQAPGSASARGAGTPIAKPAAQVRTYVVTYTLTGTYHATETFDEADGFCNGTSSTETADFKESSTGRLRLTVGKGGQVVGRPAIAKSGPLGDWTGRTEAVAEGDDCSETVEHACSGTVLGESDSSGTYLTAGTTRRKVVFDSQLTDVPQERSYATDCASNGYYPGLALHLHGALSAYDEVKVTLPWAKLRTLSVGRSRTLVAAYDQKPSGYDVATCNGEDHCAGRLTAFVHTLTLKRTR